VGERAERAVHLLQKVVHLRLADRHAVDPAEPVEPEGGTGEGQLDMP
jgi:hypothetical protein